MVTPRTLGVAALDPDLQVSIDHANARRTAARNSGSNSASNQGCFPIQPLLRQEGWGSGIFRTPSRPAPSARQSATVAVSVGRTASPRCQACACAPTSSISWSRGSRAKTEGRQAGQRRVRLAEGQTSPGEPAERSRAPQGFLGHPVCVEVLV